MTTPATATIAARPAGPGVARLAMLAESVPVAANAPAGSVAAWRLNSGAAMLTAVDGLNQGKPFVLVIDLASVQFAAPEIEMKREHYIGPIGRWAALAVLMDGPKGPGIYGAPILYTSETDAERDMYLLREADEVAALLRRRHPWQASVEIGGAVEQYELIPAGQTLEINGQTFTADEGPDALPLYVLRAGIVAEASVCLRGADRDTGPTVLASRLAAQRAATHTASKESAMDLKALLAAHPERHHGRIARLHAEGRSPADIATALLADEAKAKDDEIATLKANLEAATKASADAKAAADAKIAELQGKIDALKPPADGAAAPVEGGSDGAEAQLSAPKTVSAGIAKLRAEGNTAKGAALRTAVLRRWPALRAPIDGLHGRK